MLSEVNSDAFYGDFMSVIKSGNREFSQHNSLVLKTIDEDWMEAIEFTIPAFHTITNNPRRFIKREEAIVPVELARKTTVDSVKHLASNTQFISKIEKGTVIPSKVLNIFNEESYEIYENRVVYTLIKRVCTFVDKRYDVLKQRAGNEFISNLNVHSEFEVNDEKTELDMNVKIHQGPNYFAKRAGFDEEFKRLDALRKYMNIFKNSPFMKTLKGCVLVKSPIMKTNLMMKDPNYKACYDLWNFIEKYKNIGYTIETFEDFIDINENYQNEVTLSTLFNYMMLKNHIESIFKAADYSIEKTQEIKPIFVKKLLKPIDYNEDVIDTVGFGDEDESDFDTGEPEDFDSKVKDALRKALEHNKNNQVDEKLENLMNEKASQDDAMSKEAEEMRKEKERLLEQQRQIEKERYEKQVEQAIIRVLEIERARREKLKNPNKKDKERKKPLSENVVTIEEILEQENYSEEALNNAVDEEGYALSRDEVIQRIERKATVEAQKRKYVKLFNDIEDIKSSLLTYAQVIQKKKMKKKNKISTKDFMDNPDENKD